MSLAADDVEWVVNDYAELGVKIGDQFFFLYKGTSLVYTEPHEDGTPMLWRYVGKREFGECCHPVNYKDPTKWGTVDVNDGNEWKPLTPPRASPRENSATPREDPGARAAAWVRRCFGDAAMSRPERAARLMEEAVELAQAEGVDRDLAIKVVERAWSRPPGEPAQEAGGVGMCLAAWAEASGVDVAAETERELSRVEALSPEHFRARHAAKIAAGSAARAGENSATPDRAEVEALIDAVVGATREAALCRGIQLDGPRCYIDHASAVVRARAALLSLICPETRP